MPRPKQPRCLCGSDKPLPFGEDTCTMCKRVCGCGRLIEYEGRGYPRRRCLKCAELHPGKPRCPCGKVVPSSRRKYCSAACANEAARIKAGNRPKLNWQPDIPGVAAIEVSHQRATRFALAWLRLKSSRPLTEGIASIWEGRTRLFEVRQSEIDFTVPKIEGYYGHLPKWVMLDDEPRFAALYPRPAAYILLNSRRTAMLSTGAEPFKVAKLWKHEKMWVPRYNEWETVLLAPRRECSIQALNLDGLPSPFDE